MRKLMTVAAIVALAISCKVQKTGENTYRVVTPTKTDANKVKAEAREAGEKLKIEAQKAAQKTGKALQHAGQQIEKHSKGER